MKTTLLIPTVNEINGMIKIMPRIRREWVNQILIVDGGSTDGTIEYCKEKGYPFIIQRNKGMRYAYMEALPYIEGDIMITFSPDGNSIPELIPPLIEKMKEGYDMVIVSRYAKGAKSYDDTLITALGNWLFTTIVNILYGARYTDVMNIYRAYKKNLVKDLDVDKEITYSLPERLFHTKISWEPILSVRAAKRKLRIAEVSGDEPKRIGGKSKLKMFRWGATYLFQFIREIFIWH